MSQSRSALVSVAFGAALLAACGREKPVGCLTPSDSAECFVADFYAWYPTPKDKGGPGADMQEALRTRRKDFSPAVISALAIDSPGQSHAPNLGLAFDPFLHTADPCPKYVTGKVETTANRTRVAVHCMMKYRDPKPSVVAEVFKTDDGFRFTNFLYPDSLHPPYTDVFKILAELSPDPTVYYARGACPFECCRYGDWTMRTNAVLRSDLSDGADSIGMLHANDKVRADSGIVVLRPMGLAVVTDTAIDFHGNAHPPMRVGDTLYLLDYHGEGYRSVRLHDSVFSMAEEWDSTGKSGVRLVRKPVSFWWVHMTMGTTQGWVNMTGVQVAGSDACGG